MAEAGESERRPDRRTQRTRKAISNAFDRLVSNDESGKITASAIARTAGIDRKTFYLHYSSIDELENRKVEEVIERVIDAALGTSPAERMHAALSEANLILTTNVAVYARIAMRATTDELLERFERVGALDSLREALNPAASSERAKFYFAGALSLYSDWLRSSRTKPIDTVSNTIENAISTGERRS